MNIILNNDLEIFPINELKKFNLINKLTDISNVDMDKEKSKYILFSEKPEDSYLKNIGLVGMLSFCYSNHLKIALKPTDFWILLISEISKEVNRCPEKYRQLFTKKEGKEDLIVNSLSYEIPVDVFSEILSKKVNFDSSVLFPNFSTDDEITKSMTQSIFCDMSSPYYNYMLFLCGIREIKLLGNEEDWIKLHFYANKILDIFCDKSDSLKEYKERVLNIYLEMIKSFKEEDKNKDFWLDIFTSKNLGSGNELEINGWVKELFIKKHKVNKINNFQENVTSVKYKVIGGTEDLSFKEISGGFDIEVSKEDFVSLKYSKHIFKLSN